MRTEDEGHSLPMWMKKERMDGGGSFMRRISWNHIIKS